MINYNNISSILEERSPELINELKASLLKTGKTLNKDFKEHQILAAITFAEM
jgi:hypothetical protein